MSDPGRFAVTERVEEFCIKTGSLAVIGAVSTFILAVVHGLLILDLRLLNYLQPRVSSVTLAAAILVGLGIGGFVTDFLWDFVTDLREPVIALMTVRLDEPVKEVHPVGLMLGYCFFGFMGVATYGGAHGWASSVVSLTGLSGRVANPSNLLASAVVLHLDFASAFGAVLAVSYALALDLHIFNLVLKWLPAHSSSIWFAETWRSMLSTVSRGLPRSVWQSDPEPGDLTVVNDFTARLGSVSVLVGLSSLAGYWVLETQRFLPNHDVSIPTMLVVGVAAIAAWYGLAFLGGFVYGLVDGTIGLESRLKGCRLAITDIANSVWRVLTLRTAEPMYSLLAGSVFVALCLAIYIVSVFLLPVNRSQAPPLLSASGGLIPSYPDSALVEVARWAGVLGAASYSVPVGIRGREWWQTSNIAAGYHLTVSVYVAVTSLFAHATGKIIGRKEREPPSSWASWVRAAFMIQWFVTSGVMLDYFRTQVDPALALFLGLALLVQAVTVVQDLRERRRPFGWLEVTWVVVVLLVPVVGGFLYIVREY